MSKKLCAWLCENENRSVKLSATDKVIKVQMNGSLCSWDSRYQTQLTQMVSLDCVNDAVVDVLEMVISDMINRIETDEVKLVERN